MYSHMQGKIKLLEFNGYNSQYEMIQMIFSDLSEIIGSLKSLRDFSRGFFKMVRDFLPCRDAYTYLPLKKPTEYTSLVISDMLSGIANSLMVNDLHSAIQ